MVAVTFVLAAVAQLVPILAQGLTLPKCGELCFVDALPTSNCSATNIECLCADATFSATLIGCVQKNCMPKDGLVTFNMTSIACHAPIRDKSVYQVRLAIVFFCVTSVIVGLRFYQRIFLSSGLYADDYLILLSYACGIPNTVMVLVGLVRYGIGRDAWTLPLDFITNFLRVLYFTQIFTVKLSILAFYLRLFPGTLIRRLIWVTIFVLMGLIVIYDLITLLQCQPISHYWLGWTKETEGHCLDINALVWANATCSIILDFWMLGLPLSQLRNLQLHWRKKIGVALMFGVGVFVTAVSILRLQFLVHFGSSQNPTWDQYGTSYWSTIELNTSVCCACMPSMRIILEHLFPKIMGVKSTKNGLHDSPISLSRHQRAIKLADSDPTIKIVQSREFQVEYASDHEGSEQAGRR